MKKKSLWAWGKGRWMVNQTLWAKLELCGGGGGGSGGTLQQSQSSEGLSNSILS